MEKTKHFRYVKFSPEVIQQAWAQVETFLDNDKRKIIHYSLSICFENEEWRHDKESEFFADYLKAVEKAFFTKSVNNDQYKINIFFYKPITQVSIIAPERAKIEEIHQIFEWRN